MQKTAIAYYRVSTDRQGKSGLGLEAQRNQVAEYVRQHGFALMEEHTEVESTRKKKRPVLEQALKSCRKHKATLIIAKLDRLGRSVHFISNLLESKVEFVAVDFPQANKFTMHMLAAFAEYERDQISDRTKKALAAAARRGVKLGTYGKDVLSAKNKLDARLFRELLNPILVELCQSGFTTVRAIRDELNRRKVPTFRGAGHVWHIATVYRLILK
jgi:DNA invertase Pin-like site-specific DNA recombinase